MRRIRLAWDKFLKAGRLAVPMTLGLACASLSFAAGESPSAASVADSFADSAAVLSDPVAETSKMEVPEIDSLVSQAAPVGAASAENPGDPVSGPAADSFVDSVAGNGSAESPAASPAESLSVSPAVPPAAPLKTVLYLGGGERSPWFQLGVLYAVEEYGIPVDSVVAASWGAWIGALWTRGVPLDDIQKLMLDPAVAPFVGHDLSLPGSDLGRKETDAFEFPVSVSGKPSMRQRFTLSLDSVHFLERRKKALTPDSMQVVRALAKLRLQESLYRQRSGYRIPFSVQSCESGNPVLVGNATPQVIASLPLWREQENAESLSGELCPYHAMPIEDNAAELSIIVAADPLRAPLTGPAPVRLLKRHAKDVLESQPGVLIRAHTILDTSRAAWIQAGFTSFEKKLSEFRVLDGRREDYSVDRQGAKPWFRFEPSFDSLSSDVINAVHAYWDNADTGMVAAEKFALRLLQNPAYDSLDFNMQPGGNLWVDASVHPTFDVAVGGFGSNVFGPNAYAEAAVYYVDHVEIELVLAGFWGGNSYGLQPRLNISKLWNRHWNLQFGYDYLKLVPLKSFNNDVDRNLRVETEDRSDLTMNIVYAVDEKQQVSAEFVFGSRVFDIDSVSYGGRDIKTYPVSPMLHYRYLVGPDDNWFAENGRVLNLWGGFESIGYDDGIIDVVPIYWKLLADARYTVSPVPFVTLGLAAAAAIERYHEEGHGYVSPQSFGYRPLDLAYRQHAAATPWSTEWYNAELSSHEYAMARVNVGLHWSCFGAWIFGAYYHDFEESPFAKLSSDKFVVEPALRFAYRSMVAYAGMNRIVDKDSFGDLAHLGHYKYFVRIGNYNF